VSRYRQVALELEAAHRYHGHLLEPGVKIYESRDSALHSNRVTLDAAWSVAGAGPVREKFRSPIAAFCFWMNYQNLMRAVWKQCGSRWKGSEPFQSRGRKDR